MNKVVLLDRDGVINQDSLQYIKSEREFIPIKGSLDAISRLTQAGFLIGVATNQSGIGRGLYGEEDLQAIHDKMMALVHQAGGKIHAIEYCPHRPEMACDCRKPKTGMLRALAEKLNCSLQDVPFVGDRISDINAAKAVGAKPVVILSPMTEQEALASYPEVPVFFSLMDWVDSFLS